MSKKISENELYCGHLEGNEEIKQHPTALSKKGQPSEKKGIFKSMIGGIKNVFGSKKKDEKELTLLPREHYEGQAGNDTQVEKKDEKELIPIKH